MCKIWSSFGHLEGEHHKLTIFAAAILDFHISGSESFSVISIWYICVTLSPYYALSTKIKPIGPFKAELSRKTIIYGGHLGFPIFDQEPLKWRFGSCNFWNQHTKKPLYANFRAFFQKCTPHPKFVTYLPHYIVALVPEFRRPANVYVNSHLIDRYNISTIHETQYNDQLNTVL